MANYYWHTTLSTDTNANLTLMQTPSIYYSSKKKPKNIHEFIKGVILQKTISIYMQYYYE